MNSVKHSKRFMALLMAVSLLLTACGGSPNDVVSSGKTAVMATTMHLKRTEGTVDVSDGSGEAVALLENLDLYSGYGVDTQAASYAWVNLDDVKLTKMDEDSEIEIQKEGKSLTIEVKSGSLFFNVTEPLAEDEKMKIRTSTMVVGIRGTCGWVESTGDRLDVYLLEGTVECFVERNGVCLVPGQMASMHESGEITVVPFMDDAIPAFIWEELAEDAALVEEIREVSYLPLEGLPSAPEALPAGSPVPEDAGQPGSTAVLDLKGNVHTLSKPVLYTVSLEDIQRIDRSSMVAYDYDLGDESTNYRYDETWHGPVEQYLNSIFWPFIDTVYVIPENTEVTFQEDTGTVYLWEMDMVWDSTGGHATEFDLINYPDFDSILLDGYGYLMSIDLATAEEPEPDPDPYNGHGGSESSGPRTPDNRITFYVLKDGETANPFASAPN